MEENTMIDIEASIPDNFSRIIEKPISKLLILFFLKYFTTSPDPETDNELNKF